MIGLTVHPAQVAGRSIMLQLVPQNDAQTSTFWQYTWLINKFDVCALAAETSVAGFGCVVVRETRPLFQL